MELPEEKLNPLKKNRWAATILYAIYNTDFKVIETPELEELEDQYRAATAHLMKKQNSLKADAGVEIDFNNPIITDSYGEEHKWADFLDYDKAKRYEKKGIIYPCVYLEVTNQFLLVKYHADLKAYFRWEKRAKELRED